MAEDHDICLREPAAETGGSALSRTAVVDGRDFTSIEFDDEALGQDHAAVVVSEHRPNWREFLQRRQDRGVGDIAGVNDDVGRLKMTAYLVDEPGCLALAQMSVGEDQYIHRPTFSRWDEFGGRVR